MVWTDRCDVGAFCRIHQFEKVEQFFVTSPDNDASWKAFEEMLANAEAFYQDLEVPYQASSVEAVILRLSSSESLRTLQGPNTTACGG